MIESANGFPRMLETRKYQVGAVYQGTVEVEKYCPGLVQVVLLSRTWIQGSIIVGRKS